MKQVTVGTFEAGYSYIELVLREGNGGDAYLLAGDKPISRIKIGADVKLFKTIMKVLSHEIWEVLLSKNKLRYYAAESLADDTGAGVFMFNHAEFSDINTCASEYIEAARKPLKKAWNKWQKQHCSQQ